MSSADQKRRAEEVRQRLRERHKASEASEPERTVLSEDAFEPEGNNLPRMSPSNLKQAKQFQADLERLNAEPEGSDQEEAQEREVDPYDTFTYGRTRFDRPELRRRTDSFVDEDQISLTQHLLSGYVEQDVPVLFNREGEPAMWARIRSQLASDSLVAADVAIEVLKDRGVGASAMSKHLVQQAMCCARTMLIGASVGDMQPIPVGGKYASAKPHDSSKKETKRVLDAARYFLEKAPPQLMELLETQIMWFDERVERMWEREGLGQEDGFADVVKPG